ncbi:SAM hydrolase/SAM-dependent halogenase family protein [Patulibacter defluvii]|uniref:SAM hydrolase/SAM-dependent halogenase family protein n=1 Tax=Patulibacter defluvii TaxID=3095358 RepID=UPI002A763A5F|nr:SAM-dependent chlorinase/fluorinase [Patulibacter sp. DM4]
MAAPTVTFLSDYGLHDEFVGVCHAVIARIAPQARVVDLAHGIPSFDVRLGAITLQRALPYAEPGVHLAVVDPEVGGRRRPIAIRVAEDERQLVGPDNGLLWLAAQRFGGIVEAVDLTRSPYRLEPVSATFHGRDIFAPIAARLASGLQLADVGEPLDPDDVQPLAMPLAEVDADEVVAHAIAFDHFGNVLLDLEHEELTMGVGLRLGEQVEINGEPGVYATTFADVDPGTLLLYQDANRAMAVAVNRASARERLGLQADDDLRIRRP